jgi:hypothetical protein
MLQGFWQLFINKEKRIILKQKKKKVKVTDKSE